MFHRMILATLAFAFCVCLSPATRAEGPDLPADQALDKTSPDINFNGVPLSDTIEFLHDVMQCKIEVDWDALKNAGVTKDDRVTITATKDKKFRDVLAEVLQKVQKDKPLDFAATKTAIKVSTKDALKK